MEGKNFWNDASYSVKAYWIFCIITLAAGILIGVVIALIARWYFKKKDPEKRPLTQTGKIITAGLTLLLIVAVAIQFIYQFSVPAN